MVKLINLFREILAEEFEQKKKITGRRFIPQVVILPSNIKDQFKDHFRSEEHTSELQSH